MLFLIFLAIAAVTGQVTWPIPPTTTGPPWVTCPKNLQVGGIYYILIKEGECNASNPWPRGIWPACTPCLKLDEFPGIGQLPNPPSNPPYVCIYEMWGIKGSRFCLKPGDQQTIEKSPPAYPYPCTIYNNRMYKSPVYQQLPFANAQGCVTKCNNLGPYCRGWSYGPGPTGPCNLYSIGMQPNGDLYGLFLGLQTIGWTSSTRGCPLILLGK